MARKLGMMTYRSAEEWDQRFGRERIPEERKTGDGFAMDFEVESYLEAHANKFTGQFDANCYLYLSRASDLFDIAEHGGSISEGLKRIDADRIMVIGVPTDLLFPVQQQRQIAELLRVTAVTWSTSSSIRLTATIRSWSTWTGSGRRSSASSTPESGSVSPVSCRLRWP